MKLDNSLIKFIHSDELAKKFIKIIEKTSGVTILNTQHYSDFTLKIIQCDDCIHNNIDTYISITEEQLQNIIEKLIVLTES